MLIFLDLETTGLEAEDKICSIGFIVLDNQKITTLYDLVNEGKKISPKASSIHHITNEMLLNKANIKQSRAYQFLQEHNKQGTTLIAHNIKFDLEKLLACGMQWRGEIVDTLRVTKHLIPECEQFSLQFLRYELKLYKNEKEKALACGIKNELVSHHALSDAFIVKLLYENLLQIAGKEEMVELSFKNVLLQKLLFGKYIGRYIEDIAMNDRGYLHWMLENILDLDEDLRYSIGYHLQG
ncbi:3'-5' exonuclease [bacterium]|nr:3'-5' exonuclease [bacterium]MBU1994418.1 3'-5' exonuclease [bacterium]